MVDFDKPMNSGIGNQEFGIRLNEVDGRMFIIKLKTINFKH